MTRASSAEKLKRKRREYEEQHREDIQRWQKQAEVARKQEASASEQRKLVSHILRHHSSYFDLLQVRRVLITHELNQHHSQEHTTFAATCSCFQPCVALLSRRAIRSSLTRLAPELRAGADPRRLERGRHQEVAQAAIFQGAPGPMQAAAGQRGLPQSQRSGRCATASTGLKPIIQKVHRSIVCEFVREV